MSVFKAYDIRGKYPGEIDEVFAERVGVAAAHFLRATRAVIGRDVRTSAPAIAAACARGMARVCSQVADIGLCTTPMLYFATAGYEFDLGIMVTASHNPPDYIGFKICRQRAQPVGEAGGLKDIEKLVHEPPPAQGSGRITAMKILDDYRKHVRRFVTLDRPLRIAVDTGNGSVGTVFMALFGDLPVEVVPLCFEPDGSFPNHEPDPLKDGNVEDLRAAVRREKAAFGVAFDGDGDRAIFFDERGERIPGDLVTAILARDTLQQHKGAKIVYDLRSSRVVAEEIARLGGIPIRERVGHAFIKETMRREDAVLGGELSGHYYFRDNYFADSGTIAFAKFLNYIGRQTGRVSEVVAPLRKYHKTPEINFKVKDKDRALRQLAEEFKDAAQDRLDGLTVTYADCWFNVRPSNTEPLLRLNLEAETESRARSALKKIEKILGRPV